MRKLQLSNVQWPGQVQFQYLLHLLPTCSLVPWRAVSLMIQALCQTLVIWEENEDFHFEHMPWNSETAWISADTGFPQFWETKEDTSSCQRKVGICPSAIITAIARGCSSFYQCWIWSWSKICLCKTSWSQIAGSFCLFYFALYLESIFEVTTFTQQEPWNFRVISPE